MRHVGTFGLWLICSCLLSAPAWSDDPGLRKHLFIVGSSSSFPIISSAGETFSRESRFPAPVVESTGSGGGFKLFCAGLGPETPDITMASRRIKASERERCMANHVADIVELKIGYGGVTLVTAAGQPPLNLTRRELYLALARRVPDARDPGRVVDNPHTHWQQINRNLPAQPILVYGPPPTSGTRDILVEQIVEPGCRHDRGQGAAGAGLEPCQALREDGAYVNAGENDARLVRKVIAEPGALGILGFNFLERNLDKLQPVAIDDVVPAFEAIESGRYPVSRPLYLYIKDAHRGRTPGLDEFLTALTNETYWGPEGRLADKGLIPLPDQERRPWSPGPQQGATQR